METELLRTVVSDGEYIPLVEKFQPTERDTMRLFASRFRDLLAFDLDVGSWMKYENGVYKHITPHEAKSVFVYDFVPMLAKEAASAVKQAEAKDAKGAEALAAQWRAWIVSCGTWKRTNSIMSLAETWREFQVHSLLFDRDPELLNTPSGVLHLDTGILEPHSPEFPLSMQTKAPYQPFAECPEFERFFAQIIPDPVIRDYMHRMLGYSITGHVSEQILGFCLGDTGSNGKSTLFEIVRTVLGSYADIAAPKLLSAKNSEHTTELYDLNHKRMIVVQELDESPMDEGKLKSLTGDKVFKARQMHKDNKTIEATHKFWAFGNNMPAIRTGGTQISRRFRIFEFLVTIDKPDLTLASRILANESPGVLAWLVKGCNEWRKRGLKDQPERMKELAGQEVEDQDSVRLFLNELIEFSDKHQERVISSTIFSKYRMFCESLNVAPVSHSKLSRMVAKHCVKGRTNKQRYFTGIKLL